MADCTTVFETLIDFLPKNILEIVADKKLQEYAATISSSQISRANRTRETVIFKQIF